MWLLPVLLLLVIQGEWGEGVRTEHLQGWSGTQTGFLPGEIAGSFIHPDTYLFKKIF